MEIHGCEQQFSQITVPAIALLPKHTEEGKKGQEKSGISLGFQFTLIHLAHQHLNENMNLQSKRIYGRESS